MKSFCGKWTSTLGKSSLLLIMSMLLPTAGMSQSVMAAKTIHASYSAIELPTSIDTLEKYAKYGTIEGELAIYRRYLPAQQFQELQRILLTRVKASPIVVSQFLYTPQGELVLRRLATAIQTKSDKTQPEIEAIRTALISASADPGGLTLLNLLRKYPSSNIQINLAESFAIAAELEQVINQTNRAIATIDKKSELEAANINNYPQLPNLQVPGKFSLQKYTLKFQDLSRERLLLTDVYMPQVTSPAPIIVISHGLGSDSSNFQYLAKHLASYGFVVIVPNHPGSDTKKWRSQLHRQTTEVAAPTEFEHRPLDVKYILDQLEKANGTDVRFQGKLNLQQVGVFGQSLGGYTALALAGAKINFQQLKQDCQQQTILNTWNMSLLFQCSALQLNRREYNLEDHRVKAAIAVNPITSSIFGKQGLNQIKTPVMIVSSSDDTVAPALDEQILPFSRLANEQKYLVILKGGTHFSTIGNSNSANQQIALPADVVGDASQAHRYMNIFSLPFFKTYVAGNSKYTPYLSAAYAKSISSQSLGLSIVKSLSTTELAQALANDHNTTKLAKKNSLIS